MKYVTHFLKQMIFPLLYALIMMMLNVAIAMIGEHLTWLKYILYVLTFAMYALIIGGVSFKDGQESVKIRHMNDVERLNIIRTGEDRPLNLIKEYKPWKGFVTGLVTCLPLILLMIIQGIFLAVNPANPTRWAGAIASFLYTLIFSFFNPHLEVIAPAKYMYCLVAIPVYMLLMGFTYMLGAKKQMLLYKQVEDKHKEIYGDKD